VIRKLNLGGTFVCDQAIRSGELDVYVEYTGTAVTAVFHESVSRDSARAFERARELYAARGLTVLPPLGFNNTFAILVRSGDAATLGLKTIEDLRPVAPRWTAGFGYEFLQREDGYPGLIKTYGMQFAAARAMDLSLIYRALAERQVDVIAGDATSALIDALHFTVLDDNRHYFPPYDAVPVARASTLLRYPNVQAALEGLSGRITASDMQEMNHAADAQHENPADIARRFLSRAR